MYSVVRDRDLPCRWYGRPSRVEGVVLVRCSTSRCWLWMRHRRGQSKADHRRWGQRVWLYTSTCGGFRYRSWTISRLLSVWWVWGGRVRHHKNMLVLCVSRGWWFWWCHYFGRIDSSILWLLSNWWVGRFLLLLGRLSFANEDFRSRTRLSWQYRRTIICIVFIWLGQNRLFLFGLLSLRSAANLPWRHGF